MSTNDINVSLASAQRAVVARASRSALWSARTEESGLFLRSAVFEIRDRREAWALIADAAAAGARVEWTDARGKQGLGTFVEESGQILLRTAEGASPESSARASFALHGVPLQAECGLEDGRLVEPLRVWSRELRGATRTAPSGAYLEWFGPSDGGFQLHRAPLVDLSATGACALESAAARLPADAMFAASLCVGSRRAHGMVAMRSRRSTSHGDELGLDFVRSECMGMAELVMDLLFPRLTPRRRVAPATIIDLFEKSGYLKLRAGCVPSAGWLGLDADELSRDLVYVAESGEPVGHSSITRAYRHCWLAHQTAMLSVHPDAVEARAQLLLGLTMLATLIDGASAHVLAYYDRAKPYGRIFFAEFAESVASSNAAAVTSFDRFERDAAHPDGGFHVPDDVSVGPAQEHELALIT
ncbi:MAG TPA: hypothetical protein VFZ61_29445, partial [Polyangiales bacterium]